MTDREAAPPARRRRGTRQETEAALLDATLRLLARDGVLAGVTVRDVAQEAGVNHGQIYEYFGDRRGLLRAAITRAITRAGLDTQHWDRDFTERRRAVWDQSLRHPDVIALAALLALDGDTEFQIFPFIDRTRAALDRDREAGSLPADSDAELLHAMTAATYLGYCIFREAIARDLAIEAEDLDARAAVVFDRITRGLASGEP